MPFTIERNDLARVEADAIVVAANEALQITGGVGATVADAAGFEQLQAACDAIGGCPTGEAVVTPGFNLPARIVVHAVGPIWTDGRSGEPELLQATYANALLRAVEEGAHSIALPLISAGTYGFPPVIALSLASNAIREFLKTHDVEVRLVLYDRSALVAGLAVYDEVAAYIDDRYVDEHSAYGSFILSDADVDALEARSAAPMSNAPRNVMPHEEKSRGIFARIGEAFAGKRKESSYTVAETTEAAEASETAEAVEAAAPTYKAEAAADSLEALTTEAETLAYKAAAAAVGAAAVTDKAAAAAADEAAAAGGAAAAVGETTARWAEAPVAEAEAPADKASIAAETDAVTAAPSMAPQALKDGQRAPDDAFAIGEAIREEDTARAFAANYPKSSSSIAPDTSSYASDAQAAWGPAGGSLSDWLDSLDEPFSTTLLALIDARGFTDVEVYKRANMSRQLFSKIRGDEAYRPMKKTVLALAVALKLNLAETEDLLRRAGFALSRSNKADVIVEYFIVNGKYDMYEINETLYAFDQPLL